MKLHGEWLILAENVLVDQHTQSLTFVTMLDEVRALDFPTLHPRFAFASLFTREGGPPETPEPCEFRLVRIGEGGKEEVVHTVPAEWRPGVERMRIFTNFGFLRLRRPESVRFRVDWRAPKGRWHEGPSVPLAIKALDVPEEQREQLRAQMKRLREENTAS